MNRRQFLGTLGLATVAGAQSPPRPKADFTLRIGPVNVELAPKKLARTIGYNGTSPGPLLRMPEGKSVTIDVTNGTHDPEIAHWHGLQVPSSVDGSMEEGTPMVAPGATGSYTFMPAPSGTRWYHTRISAGRNLKRGLYTGQFGFFISSRKTKRAITTKKFFWRCASGIPT